LSDNNDFFYNNENAFIVICKKINYFALVIIYHFMQKYILTIYPEFTSTKVAVYQIRKQIFLCNVKHPIEDLGKYKKITDQVPYRLELILSELKYAGFEADSFEIVVGRGGLLKPLPGGVYQVNKQMLKDTQTPFAEHESNLGCILAFEIAQKAGKNVPAIIVDPACVDEMDEIAKMSGLPELPRKSILHTINQRTKARNFARELGKEYNEINVIVAHLDKGISVGAHKQGKIIDVNNGLIGDGPMTTERSGSIPAGDLVDLCFSGQHSKGEILAKLKFAGGVFAYIGTNNIKEIEKRISENDKQAELALSAVAYQVAKEIGGLSTVLEGNVDGILITGEQAYSDFLIKEITKRVKHLGMIRVYPGDDQMESFALHGYMVLNNEIEVKEYV